MKENISEVFVTCESACHFQKTSRHCAFKLELRCGVGFVLLVLMWGHSSNLEVTGRMPIEKGMTFFLVSSSMPASFGFFGLFLWTRLVYHHFSNLSRPPHFAWSGFGSAIHDVFTVRGMSIVPVVVVNYAHEDILVNPPNSPVQTSKEGVVSTAVSGKFLPPKSTRHMVRTRSGALMPIAVLAPQIAELMVDTCKWGFPRSCLPPAAWRSFSFNFVDVDVDVNAGGVVGGRINVVRSGTPCVCTDEDQDCQQFWTIVVQIDTLAVSCSWLDVKSAELFFFFWGCLDLLADRSRLDTSLPRALWHSIGLNFATGLLEAPASFLPCQCQCQCGSSVSVGTSALSGVEGVCTQSIPSAKPCSVAFRSRSILEQWKLYQV